MLKVPFPDLSVLSFQLAAGTFLNSYSLQPSGENCPQVNGASLPQMPTSYIVLSPLPALDQPWKPGANDKQDRGQRVQKPPYMSPGRIDSAVHFPCRAPRGSGHILVWLLLSPILCLSLYHNFSAEHFLAKSLDKNPHLRLCIS